MLLSNPTRPKLILDGILQFVVIAPILGIIAGLIAGGILEILFSTDITLPMAVKRILGWLLIGGAVGIAEGWTWRWRSIEAGDERRFQRRLLTSIIAGIAGGYLVALLFEFLWQYIGWFSRELHGIYAPLGFFLFGMLFSLILSFSASPCYMAALRAGAGFEYTYIPYNIEREHTDYPRIQKEIAPTLKFVNDDYEDQIEEGRSIQLPPRRKIKIGSVQDSYGLYIYIPGLPPHVADLVLNNRETWLFPNPKTFDIIEINGERLTSAAPRLLDHNYVLTFHVAQGGYNGKKVFKFVHYNRFLDPQA